MYGFSTLVNLVLERLGNFFNDDSFDAVRQKIVSASRLKL